MIYSSEVQYSEDVRKMLKCFHFNLALIKYDFLHNFDDGDTDYHAKQYKGTNYLYRMQMHQRKILTKMYGCDIFDTSENVATNPFLLMAVILLSHL